MLGAFNLLPLLKGWSYKNHVAKRKSVVRGASPVEIMRLDEMGWLFGISLITTDAYGTLLLEYQSTELESGTFTLYPEAVKPSWQQDPGGFAVQYLRPDANSTAGLYFIVIAPGFQGFMFPYVPTITMKLLLPNESTQNSAYIYGVASTIAITDRKAFIRSLRRVLGAKADLWIDPALLVTGPGKFEEVE